MESWEGTSRRSAIGLLVRFVTWGSASASAALTACVSALGRRPPGKAVGRLDQVPPGGGLRASLGGDDSTVVVNVGGTIKAMQGICSHEYFELDKGFLNTEGAGDSKGPTLTCALHLSRFDLVDGYPLDPPAEDALAIYPVVVEDGRVLIEVPEGPLEVNG